jgi:hypothetical protein
MAPQTKGMRQPQARYCAGVVRPGMMLVTTETKKKPIG